mmetsp:Transcript_135816/g.321884  ORF Transcript_135816/g.321884 Transcript_135816/m.321884 type:complete len:204 (+) Transcript_135816:1539-2150(+)
MPLLADKGKSTVCRCLRSLVAFGFIFLHRTFRFFQSALEIAALNQRAHQQVQSTAFTLGLLHSAAHCQGSLCKLNSGPTLLLEDMNLRQELQGVHFEFWAAHFLCDFESGVSCTQSLGWTPCIHLCHGQPIAAPSLADPVPSFLGEGYCRLCRKNGILGLASTELCSCLEQVGQSFQSLVASSPQQWQGFLNAAQGLASQGLG